MREGKPIVVRAVFGSRFVRRYARHPKWHVRGQENDILQSKLNTESVSHSQIYARISTVHIHATLYERAFNYTNRLTNYINNTQTQCTFRADDAVVKRTNSFFQNSAMRHHYRHGNLLSPSCPTSEIVVTPRGY